MDKKDRIERWITLTKKEKIKDEREKRYERDKKEETLKKKTEREREQ